MPRQPELVSHWYTLIDGLNASSEECYRQVATDLRDRSIRDLEIAQIVWQESGLLSAKRVYLRVSRGRSVFDICAAPFGNGFFFSWRLAILPPQYGLLFAVLLILATGAGYTIFSGVPQYTLWRDSPKLYHYLTLFPFFPPTTELGILAGFAAFVLMLIIIRVFGGAEAVQAIPLIGWLYKICFAQDTYYRIDTALMFQESVRRAVTDVIDGLIKQQGLRALSDQERQPRLRDFGRG